MAAFNPPRGAMKNTRTWVLERGEEITRPKVETRAQNLMMERVGGDLVQLHRSWLEGVTVDDQLWFQSVITSRSQGLRLHGGLPHNDRWIWKILQLGYSDGRVADRPWDASTHSMRYTAVVGDSIQASVEVERARVDHLEAEVKTEKKASAALKVQVNHLVEVLADYQEEKERSVKVLDNLERLNQEERDQNKALWDIFEERCSSIEGKMTSMRDQNILLAAQVEQLLQRVENQEDTIVNLGRKVCHCNDRVAVAPSSSSGSGSYEDPVDVDRAESPSNPEYHTPPIASPITSPIEENLIPISVQVDLGSALSSDSGASSNSELGDIENRPHCCRVARIAPSSSAVLREITLEDELISSAAVQQAIGRAEQIPILPRWRQEGAERLYQGDFEVWRELEDLEMRGSPIVDQLHLESFLEMLERDACSLEGPGTAHGQLTHLQEMGETEWALNLTVPISNELGVVLYDRLEGSS